MKKGEAVKQPSPLYRRQSAPSKVISLRGVMKNLFLSRFFIVFTYAVLPSV